MISHKLNCITQSEIIVVEHEACGAYEKQYGELSQNEMFVKHTENAIQCCDILWEKFNPVSGTIDKIPNLVIKSYILTINGCNLVQIYQKS